MSRLLGMSMKNIHPSRVHNRASREATKKAQWSHGLEKILYWLYDGIMGKYVGYDVFSFLAHAEGINEGILSLAKDLQRSQLVEAAHKVFLAGFKLSIKILDPMGKSLVGLGLILGMAFYGQRVAPLGNSAELPLGVMSSRHIGNLW